MTTTITTSHARAGEPVAFVLPTLPLALPEPFESKCARVGIEPWMYEPDYFKFYERICNKKIDAFEKMDSIEFFTAENPIAPGDRYAVYELLNGITLTRNRDAHTVFKENLDTLAHSIARDAVKARNTKRIIRRQASARQAA